MDSKIHSICLHKTKIFQLTRYFHVCGVDCVVFVFAHGCDGYIFRDVVSLYVNWPVTNNNNNKNCPSVDGIRNQLCCSELFALMLEVKMCLTMCRTIHDQLWMHPIVMILHMMDGSISSNIPNESL